MVMLASQNGLSDTSLPSTPVTIDFSKALKLSDPQNARLLERVRAIARSYANEGTVYEQALKFDSLNLVLNPVLGSDKFKHHFRFNLKARDGKIFNCIGLGSADLSNHEVGCYAAIP
jgi:hypothetical protein